MAHRGWKRGGFTPAKKAKAIEALGKYGNVADACRVAGVSDTTFYRHLNKDSDFARLCDQERARAARPLETLAWERATEGSRETIIRGGEVVQIKIKPSDSMLRLLLQASDPKKYGRPSRGGATRKQIERGLRKKIEAEVRAELARKPRVDAKEIFDKLAARVAEIKREREEKERGRASE
ncbi:MAG TPA: hypothetical protein VF574_15200 [Allosphingosinicella sp.]|jgi:AcrR family transcriptional regulator